MIAGLASLLLAVTVLWWRSLSRVLKPPSAKPEIAERRLTANSAENPLDGAAISPDGRYLAFSDSSGIYLKLIRSGETHRAPAPVDFSGHVESWFPDGVHQLVSRVEKPGASPSLWSISVVGGPPRKLLDAMAGAHPCQRMGRTSRFFGAGPGLGVPPCMAGKCGL